MADPLFSLIIPAAGLGKRMETEVPKPYLMLGDKSVLEHALRCFTDIPGLLQVIIATSPVYRKQTDELLNILFPGTATVIVNGGQERQDSVFNALKHVHEEAELIAVHDAVRPFAPKKAIYACLQKANDQQGAILGVPVKDTIKRVDDHRCIKETPSRSELWQAQTPQIFDRKLLSKAYSAAAAEKRIGTDDASLIEAVGGAVHIVEGSRDNFKLTYPLDFKTAELLLVEKNSNE